VLKSVILKSLKSMIQATAVAAFACVLPSCVAASKHAEVIEELTLAQDELESTRGTLMEVSDELLRMQEQENDLLSRADELASQASAARQREAELAAELAALQEKYQLRDIGNTETVYDGRGGYGYRVEGDLLFASGSAKVSSAGETVLEEIAAELNRNASAKVRIDGHTDSDPVRKTKDLYPAGNIELGAQRAIAVYEALEKYGVDAGRMSVMSYADAKPAAKTKAQNRRVEIYLTQG